MQVSVHPIATILALALASVVLSGCGTINEKLAAGAGDFIPQWAGGLPPDAPPRRGTPQYDEYMKEQERKRLQPAANANAAAPTPTEPATAMDPVH
jgi:predicted small secreted protein